MSGRRVRVAGIAGQPGWDGRLLTTQRDGDEDWSIVFPDGSDQLVTVEPWRVQPIEDDPSIQHELVTTEV